MLYFQNDIRNNLKSGYPNEGQPAFITGGKRDINTIFKNLIAQPTNFEADNPGDVIQYIAAHDNLTLFDIIAQSIKKDPSKAENYAEIHRRLRLGNLMVLTAQGTPFIHLVRSMDVPNNSWTQPTKLLFQRIRFQTNLTCCVIKTAIHLSIHTSSMTLMTLAMLSTSLTGPRQQIKKHILKMSRVVTT